MKTKLIVLVATCLILGSVRMFVYAQESDAAKKETEGQSQMQMGPGMMQQMIGEDNSMMEQCCKSKGGCYV